MRVQLNQPKSIAAAVAAVSAALLGQSAAASDNGKVESSLLVYSETNRVKAAEAIANVTKYLEGERTFTLRLTYDGLTGASPSGATPSRKVQTFTRPSGNGGYYVKPGDIPLDDTFRDQRFALDGSLGFPLGRLSTANIGAHFSNEHDYTSFGINGGLTRDFNDKNTTLGISASVSHDLVGAVGGAPVPYSSMPIASSNEGGGGEGGEGESEGEGGGTGPRESKNTLDAVASLTQIITRTTIARFNYSYSRASGYLNDPYKILSVVDGPSGADPGEPVDYIYEKRPSTRTKNSVYGELRQYIFGQVVDFSYRYYWDDWQVKSHTFDLFYRIKLGSNALQPHVRWYNQTAADIHRYFLVSGEPLPVYASADYRLAKFDAYTVGMQYYFPIQEGWQVSLGAEYYVQRGDKSPPEAFGSLRNYDLFPDMTSIMFRLGIGHDF